MNIDLLIWGWYHSSIEESEQTRYKIICGIDGIDPAIFFEPVKDSKTRGHKYKLCKPTSLSKHIFSNSVVDTWNFLPAQVKEPPDINSFNSPN